MTLRRRPNDQMRIHELNNLAQRYRVATVARTTFCFTSRPDGSCRTSSPASATTSRSTRPASVVNGTPTVISSSRAPRLPVSPTLNGHCRTTLACLKSATFGIMHCGKAPIAISLSMLHAAHHSARACTATKCGKATPPLHGSDCGGFEARVTLPGSQQRLPRARELELRRPRHALRGYPYAFCNCLPQRTRI